LKIILKPVFIIAIVAVAMIGIMVPSAFAVQDNATIEGNLNPFNRSEEVYVVYVDPSSEMREITFSIYGSEGVIFSSTSHLNSGGTFQNFYVKFFPPLFQDNTKYTIEVVGPGIVGRQTITIEKQFTSYQSESLPIVRSEESEAEAAEAKAAEAKAAEAKAAEAKAAEAKAAEAEAKAAEAKAAEAKAAEQRAAEQRAEAAIRAAEAKAAQDLTNLLIIGGIAIIIISLLIILIKRKNKKSSAPQRFTTSTYSPPTPPPSPSGNTETSTMFFYECPKCHSGDIENNPDGSVNCPSCGYRG
jgi:uncharacterized low-complexity protein